MNEREDLVEIVMQAMLATAQSPFYADEQDSIDLANEIADAIIAAGWPRVDR